MAGIVAILSTVRYKLACSMNSVVQESAKGQYLWEEMLKQVPISDSRSFGLQYTDCDNDKVSGCL